MSPTVPLCLVYFYLVFSLTLLCLSRLLDQVIDAYTRMLKAKKGEIDAIVTTAEPLTPQQEKALAAGLKAQVNNRSPVCPCVEGWWWWWW